MTFSTQSASPVLLTYNSDVVGSHREVTTTFLAAFKTEVGTASSFFCKRNYTSRDQVHLFLFPMKSKTDLIVAAYD